MQIDTNRANFTSLLLHTTYANLAKVLTMYPHLCYNQQILFFAAIDPLLPYRRHSYAKTDNLALAGAGVVGMSTNPPARAAISRCCPRRARTGCCANHNPGGRYDHGNFTQQSHR
jgi:hypothetical protein